jgi:tetratricopeptide (TPR) repeat protein
MENTLLKYRIPLLCFLLGAVTFAVYLPVRNHEFVLYDDDNYVINNPSVKSGLSWQNVKWAFTTGRASNWHPLTWLSLMLDVTIFGVKSGPLHLVNVLFHVANTILLFLILSRMTKMFWPGAFVAALFALHPLHVESVAWVAERKDVLSTLFWLLTTLAYTCYCQRPSAARYITALVFFALGLMTKPMLVTLPFTLILLDYWPLNRLNSQFKILNSFTEKLPFFILTVISSIITFLAQRKGGALAVIPFKERIANAVCSYLAYIGKMFWPTRLAVLYPHPANFLPVSMAVITLIILIIMTVFFIRLGRRYKYLVVGWFWYIGTLVPVIGIVQAGSQAMADRYTYIPLIGLFIIIAFAAADVVKKISSAKYIISVLAIVILLACTLATSAQLKYWKNSSSLFEHTLAVTKNNPNILNNYGNVLSSRGRHAEAVNRFSEALKFLPDAPDIHNNLGKALLGLGRTDDAIEQYKIALKLDPRYNLAHCNLGIAYAAKGDYDKAIEEYKIYLGANANVGELHENLANMLAGQGKVDDALSQFQLALAAKPDSAEVLSNLGFAFAQKGDPNQAIDYYNKALQLDTNNIITHGRLALALAAVGKLDESIVQCRVVLAADPNDAEMQTNLGLLFQAKGLLDQAVESYKKALQIDPNSQKARNQLNLLTQKQPQN